MKNKSFVKKARVSLHVIITQAPLKDGQTDTESCPKAIIKLTFVNWLLCCLTMPNTMGIVLNQHNAVYESMLWEHYTIRCLW